LGDRPPAVGSLSADRAVRSLIGARDQQCDGGASMNQRRETATQTIAIAAFIAAIIIIVTTLLASISAECIRGTPFLPTIFPCFAGQ
jgi:hypothetical protein